MPLLRTLLEVIVMIWLLQRMQSWRVVPVILRDEIGETNGVQWKMTFGRVCAGARTAMTAAGWVRCEIHCKNQYPPANPPGRRLFFGIACEMLRLRVQAEFA